MRDDEEHGPGARRPPRRRRAGKDRGDAGADAAAPDDARGEVPSRTPDAALTDAQLLAGLRRDDPRAFAEYVRRFHRLLAYYPWRAGLAADASRDLALEVLEDAMLDLIAPDAVVPRALHAWLVTRVRRRLANDVRAATRRRVREAAVAYDAGDGSGAAAALCSEATLRLCRGVDSADDDGRDDDRGDAPDGVAARLGAALAEGLDADERRLLAWLAEGVPQREIADALGATHAALRKRVERLRVRLRVEATRALEGMSPADRRVAQRLLGRGAARDAGRGGARDAPPRGTMDTAAPADGAITRAAPQALAGTTADAPGSGR